MKYIMILITGCFFAVSNSLLAADLQFSEPVFELLSNRNLITEKTLLWSKDLKHINRNDRMPDKVEIFADAEQIHKSLKNLRIVYSGENGEQVLFQEQGSYINGTTITRVFATRHLPVLLIESRWQSTGATGDGSDGKDLKIVTFDNRKVEITDIKLTENGWGSPYNTENYSYLLAGSGDVHLFLDSVKHNKLLKIDYDSLLIEEISAAQADKVRPSYDCGKTGNGIEQQICADQGLAALDSIMAQLYRSKKNSAVTKTQKQWLQQRKTCSALAFVLVEQCLTIKYRQRIETLLAE